MPGLLALDLGLKTGWAFHPDGRDRGARMRHGVWILGTNMADPEPCWAAVADAISDAHGVFAFDRLAIEAPLPGFKIKNATFATLAMGLATMARVVAWRRELTPTQVVNVQSVRLKMTGNGHATERDIFAWVRTRGYEVTTDHEADALLLAHFVIAPVQSAWPAMLPPSRRHP